MYLLLLFVGVPILELALLIQVGSLIGVMPTIALALLTALAGTALLRRQGFAVLARARASLERNELPVREVFDGLCLGIAGALLLTPGFITDSLGLLLFVPAVREALRGRLFRVLRRRADMHVFVNGVEVPPQDEGRRPGREEILDGEFREVKPEDSAGQEDGRRELPPLSDSRWRP